MNEKIVRTIDNSFYSLISSHNIYTLSFIGSILVTGQSGTVDSSLSGDLTDYLIIYRWKHGIATSWLHIKSHNFSLALSINECSMGIATYETDNVADIDDIDANIVIDA